MNTTILNNDIQNFINANLNEDPTKLILKGSSFFDITIQEIVEQIISKNKCKTKLPSWFKTTNIYFPNKINVEQTSSEITAKYKSDLLSGDSIIDITGGFGVDCFAFSDKFKEVTHCEINEELSKIVTHNYLQFGIQNIITIANDGLKYLKKKNIQYDWIYADPSRRSDSKGKVFLLEDCTPNIPLNIDLLYQYSNNILIKLSPIIDISSAINKLKYTKEIHVVSVQNEVKELLFILQKDYNSSIKINTINIKKDTKETFNSIYKSFSKSTFSLPKLFLYEPNSAILKAGFFNDVSHQLIIDKLHINSHLYTSDNLISFPGRRFKINQITSYDKKLLKKINPNQKANITTRNFPQTVAQIRNKTGIKDGGNTYLFFTTDINDKPIVLVCEKV